MTLETPPSVKSAKPATTGNKLSDTPNMLAILATVILVIAYLYIPTLERRHLCNPHQTHMRHRDDEPLDKRVIFLALACLALSGAAVLAAAFLVARYLLGAF
jgi:hypothetical protein